jgi:hypothetical protein
MGTDAEAAQEVLRRARAVRAGGGHVWTPEQLRDIVRRAEGESLESIAAQYHTSRADVERGLREARGEGR